MRGSRTLISPGDLIDLYHLVRRRGYNALASRLRLSSQARTVAKWAAAPASSDFWIIPHIRRRWNAKCTGDPNVEYEDYVVSKYLAQAQGLRMLSVGCGTGARERKFARHPNFELIEGIDLVRQSIAQARQHASGGNLTQLRYILGSFTAHRFEPNSYDVVLFNASLHHFDHIDRLLGTKVRPMLRDGGYLVLFDYVGPSRLQWVGPQLALANRLLRELPAHRRERLAGGAVKRRIYRPGLLRMLLVDPSEAIDSEAIIPSVHKHFRVMEERKVGGDISQLLFKDIAHNFLGNDPQTESLLAYLLAEEDEYLRRTGRSDLIFGVYQK